MNNEGHLLEVQAPNIGDGELFLTVRLDQKLGALGGLTFTLHLGLPGEAEAVVRIPSGATADDAAVTIKAMRLLASALEQQFE